MTHEERAYVVLGILDTKAGKAEFQSLMDVFRAAQDETLEQAAQVAVEWMNSNANTDVLAESLASLDAIDIESRDRGFETCSEQAKATARRLLVELHCRFPLFYDVYPTDQKEVAIEVSGRKGRRVLILCGPDESAACFVTIDGDNRRARFTPSQKPCPSLVSAIEAALREAYERGKIGGHALLREAEAHALRDAAREMRSHAAADYAHTTPRGFAEWLERRAEEIEGGTDGTGE